jgi:hypothetical protein
LTHTFLFLWDCVLWWAHNYQTICHFGVCISIPYLWLYFSDAWHPCMDCGRMCQWNYVTSGVDISIDLVTVLISLKSACWSLFSSLFCLCKPIVKSLPHL